MFEFFDSEIAWMPTEVTHIWRAVNIVLATIVAGLCGSYYKAVDNRYQKARFLGLAMFCWLFVWGTLSKVGDPFNVRVPLWSATLLVCAYGMFGFRNDSRRA